VELWTTDPRAVSLESSGALGQISGYPDIPSPYNEDYSSLHQFKDLKKLRTYVGIIAENVSGYFPQGVKPARVWGDFGSADQ
jgi:hypothetical protein